jgi:hypothetical protein
MPSEPQSLPEQEISIKARSHELFVESQPVEVAPPVKPFPVYLRETPAVPISGTIKAVLWMVGIIVVLLFIAAVWRLMIRHGSARPPARARVAARTGAFQPLLRSFSLGIRPPHPSPLPVGERESEVFTPDFSPWGRGSREC